MLHHMVGALSFSFVSEYRGRGPSFFPCTNIRRPFSVLEDLGKAMTPFIACLGVVG